jgi:HlyD family secretion protein
MASKLDLPEAETGSELKKMPSAAVGGKQKKRRRKWIIVVAVLVMIVVLLIVMRSCAAKKAEEALASAYTVETVERRDISVLLTGTGTLEPADSYAVTSLVTGEILSAPFEEGDIVEKEQLLYKVDTSDIENSIERGELSLEKAQLSYDQLMDSLGDLAVKSSATGVITEMLVEVGDSIGAGQTVARVRDSSVMTLRLPFVAAEAAGMYVGQTATVTLYSSFEQLNGTVSKISGADEALPGQMIVRYVTIEVTNPGGISASTVASATVGEAGCVESGNFEYRSENAITADASGKVAVIYADEGSTVSKGQAVLRLESSSLENQVSSTELSLRDAELALENQNDQLENYTITSPISGTIIEKDFKEGDKISAGSSAGQSLCTIFDLSYLTMTLRVDELDISKVEVGQTVRVTAEAVEGREYEGIVTRVNINGTTAGGVTTYPVTIRIDETEGLLPGMNVDVEIEVERRENVLAIPVGAVQRGDIVLSNVGDQGNTVAGAPDGFGYAPVELGVSDDDYIEITGGLSEGDSIAYMGYQASNFMEQMMQMGMMGPGGGYYTEG